MCRRIIIQFIREINVYSVVLLVTVDFALWAVNAPLAPVTLGLSTPLSCLCAFLFTGIGVFLVQKYMTEDDTGAALAKGFVLGTLAGVPTPLAGILGGSGIVKLKKD